MHVIKPPSGEARKPENRHEFQIGDQVFDVPKLQFVRPGLVAKMTGKDASAAMFTMIEEYAPGALDLLEDNDQLVDLFEGWQEDSGISVGESSGSPDSSPSTGEPSTAISSSQDEVSTTSEPAA